MRECGARGRGGGAGREGPAVQAGIEGVGERAAGGLARLQGSLIRRVITAMRMARNDSTMMQTYRDIKLRQDFLLA